MLHNEARKLLIEAWNRTHNAKEVAECFGVNTSTVYRLVKRMRETGSVETRTSLRGRKPSLSQKDIENIDCLIQQQPDITINEIIDTLQLHVSDETVRKTILKLGYVYNRNRSVPDVQQKRKNWEQLIPENAANSLVFLDESGVNTNMTRHYARARKEKRAIDSTPVNTPTNTTILSSVRITGETAYTIYQGGMTAERFAEYLSSTLLPTLSETDIIVMDNMRSHHAKIVKELLDRAGVRYLYLPPYSPDLNPIEKMWSKLKANLRKQKIRIAAQLPEAIKRAFSTIRQSDCFGWFRSCGYVP